MGDPLVTTTASGAKSRRRDSHPLFRFATAPTLLM